MISVRHAFVALLIAFAVPEWAGAAVAQAEPARAAPADRRLPASVTTDHQVELPGRTLRFKATAGSLPLVDPSGAVQAEIAFVAYRLDGAPAASRPVTFAVNGGPGASSAYLHLLVAGPWRLPLDPTAISPSAPPVTEPNAETWLDFTDLVFIDPVGTGYSRASSPERARDYHSVESDIGSLSAFVARWLRENDRLASPKFFLGESYGGFRGPLLAEHLANETGIGLSGLILVSPVLDFAWLSAPRWQPMDFVTKLPSIVAAMREKRQPIARPDLIDAERYASGEYLVDLLRGASDPAAEGRMVERVAALTGLDPSFVRERGARLDLRSLQRELMKGEGRVVSAYDTAISAFDPDPTAPRSEAQDPGLDDMRAVLSGAAVNLLWTRLGWRVPNARYELLNNQVSRSWRYESGRQSPESFSELRRSLARDSKLRVLVAHGLTDLVTPYFASALLLRQIPAFGQNRVSLQTYPGGHMFYIRDMSRAAFRTAAQDLITEALNSRGPDRRD